MSLADYRRQRGMTQVQLAEALDLSANSFGHVSRIENGGEATIQLALKIEAWSNGEVPAASLLSPDDAELLAHHRRLSPAHPVDVAA